MFSRELKKMRPRLRSQAAGVDEAPVFASSHRLSGRAMQVTHSRETRLALDLKTLVGWSATRKLSRNGLRGDQWRSPRSRLLGSLGSFRGSLYTGRLVGTDPHVPIWDYFRLADNLGTDGAGQHLVCDYSLISLQNVCRFRDVPGRWSGRPQGPLRGTIMAPTDGTCLWHQARPI